MTPSDPPTGLVSLRRKLQGRKSKAMGAATEGVVRHRLNSMGFLQVSKIEVGWRIIRKLGRIVDARPMERVPGDFHCIEPRTGRAVLVECKYRESPLVYSDIEAHQIDALNATQAAGGIAILAWSSPEGVFLLQWPALEPRQSITAERAAALDMFRALSGRPRPAP